MSQHCRRTLRMVDTPIKKNWTVAERDILVASCENSTQLATGKFTPTLTAAQKDCFWRDITERVNSVSPVQRTVKQVKKKWVDLKSETKKKAISHRIEVEKTGGGPAPVFAMDEWEVKILNSIPTCSVEGLTAGFDTFKENENRVIEEVIEEPRVTCQGTAFANLPNNTSAGAMSTKRKNNDEVGDVSKRVKCDTLLAKGQKSLCDEMNEDAMSLMKANTSALIDLTIAIKELKETVRGLKTD